MPSTTCVVVTGLLLVAVLSTGLLMSVGFDTPPAGVPGQMSAAVTHPPPPAAVTLKPKAQVDASPPRARKPPAVVEQQEADAPPLEPLADAHLYEWREPAADTDVPDADFDIVYLWVNGSDPTHLAAKRRIGIGGREDDRDRDNAELFYSLRSLDKFLPWWNGTLYIVAEQTPCWLNLQHPRLRMVRHREIFINHQDTLPTFNSQAIEPNLFRILGLRKHFVLMNDDVFFGAPLTPQDFFHNGRLVLRFEKWTVKGGKSAMADQTSVGGNIWRASMFHSRAMIEAYYGLADGVEPGPKYSPALFRFLKHAPTVLHRDRLAKLWQMFPGQMKIVTESRTRTKAGFHCAYVHHHTCLLDRGACEALPAMQSDKEAIFLTAGSNANVFKGAWTPIQNQQYKFFNVNDEQDFSVRKDLAERVFTEYIPQLLSTPSVWETRACPPHGYKKDS